MGGVSKDILSFLKLRASWGQNGNVSVLNGYPYTATITVGGSSAFFTTGESSHIHMLIQITVAKMQV